MPGGGVGEEMDNAPRFPPIPSLQRVETSPLGEFRIVGKERLAIRAPSFCLGPCRVDWDAASETLLKPNSLLKLERFPNFALLIRLSVSYKMWTSTGPAKFIPPKKTCPHLPWCLVFLYAQLYQRWGGRDECSTPEEPGTRASMPGDSATNRGICSLPRASRRQ